MKFDHEFVQRGVIPVPVQVGVADVESEGPSRAAGCGLVDRLPVRGAFVAFLCVCTSVPALSWGQYRPHGRKKDSNLLIRAARLISNRKSTGRPVVLKGELTHHREVGGVTQSSQEVIQK